MIFREITSAAYMTTQISAFILGGAGDWRVCEERDACQELIPWPGLKTIICDGG